MSRNRKVGCAVFSLVTVVIVGILAPCLFGVWREYANGKLEEAVYLGELEDAEDWLRLCPQVNTTLMSRLLRASVHLNDREMVELLIVDGADVRAELIVNGKLRAISLTECHDPEMFEYLTSQGATWKGNEGILLTTAASNDRLELIQHYLELGFDPNTKDELGYTAIMKASANNANRVLKCLIESGVSLDSKNEMGETPLFLAVSSKKDCQKAVVLLLEAGATPGAKTLERAPPEYRKLLENEYMDPKN